MDSTADLHLCCLHRIKTGFLTTLPIYYSITMSSDGRRPGSNTRGRGDGRPGSRGTRTTAANGKPGPGRKSAASNDYMKNKSNSATMNEKR